jgi:hypothetical protein
MELGRSAPMLMSASPDRAAAMVPAPVRARPATGSSTTIAEFCSTDSGSLFHRHAQLAAANQAEDAQRDVEQALQKAVQHSHDLTTIIRFNTRNDVV